MIDYGLIGEALIGLGIAPAMFWLILQFLFVVAFVLVLSSLLAIFEKAFDL